MIELAHLTIQELSDLCDAMMSRMGLELLPVITKANREDVLDDLLASLGMSDLLDSNRDHGAQDPKSKIIVLGASNVKTDNLRNLARKNGFDPDRFEFQLDYDRLKHFDFSKIRNTMGYVAILAGPMPHSTPGAKEAHSNEYPPLIKLEAGDDLKITNNSFKRALRELHHLGAA